MRQAELQLASATGRCLRLHWHRALAPEPPSFAPACSSAAWKVVQWQLPAALCSIHPHLSTLAAPALQQRRLGGDAQHQHRGAALL